MKYSIVNTEKAVKHGFNPNLFRRLKDGTMIVNENHLRDVDSDIDKAAALLGGVVLSEAETREQINKIR